ncbi:hypothetical protein CsSME_00022062 [Camellia sinensis var. sinensis]
MKRIMKKMRRSLSDIISNLPESVKETILACLPIQDAVRTSVLSTKWRYTWTKLPQLVFDDTFCSDLFCKTKDKLMTIIYQVLLFHHGPIPKFTCSLSGLKSCSEFDQLILFVSKKGIQELNLNIQNGELYKLPSSLFSCLQLKILTLHSCIFKSPPEFKGFSRLLKLELYEVVVTADILSRLISSSPLLERLSLQNSTSIDCLEINAPNLRFLLCEIHAGSICLKNTVQLASIAIGLMASMDEFTLLIEKGEPYKLPSSLFSCEQLRYLSLRSCVFKSPPEFKGFSRLLKLALYRVFVASDTLSSLISSCPLLEKLSLKRSFSSDCLEINTPNLRFLACEIYGSSISLKNTTRLARVSICFMGIFNAEGITQAETSKLVMLFGSLPVVEFLLLDYHTIRYMSAGGVPKRLPTTLNNLKTLKLLSICFEEVNEISVILCLIRSSPNLEEITIVVRRCETADVIDHVPQLLEMQDWSDVSLNQLQVVELGNLSGTQSELKFIGLLLAISPVLETMFIQTDSEKVADKGLRILTEVTRFPRWSPHAEIKFEYKDKDQV